jgi:hypothetical protein
MISSSFPALALALWVPSLRERAQLEPPTVTFSEVRDAVPTTTFGFATVGYFDSSATAPEVADPNRLRIGLLSFGAGEVNFFFSNPGVGHDTLSFRVTAPEGYVLRSLTYSQLASGGVSRQGFATTGTSWVVDGQPFFVGSRAITPSTSNGSANFTHTVDLSGQGKSSVTVAISTHVSAGGYVTVGSANMSMTAATVQAHIEPIPPKGRLQSR